MASPITALAGTEVDHSCQSDTTTPAIMPLDVLLLETQLASGGCFKDVEIVVASTA